MSDDNAWYHVIHCGEDGDVHYEQLDRKTLLERLNADEPYYGTNDAFRLAPPQSNPQYWEASDSGSKLLIIKGNVVQPREKTVVKEYDI